MKPAEFIVQREPGGERRITVEERYARAIQKAKLLRLRAYAVPNTGGRRFKVRSQRAGQPRHLVDITTRGVICDCEAARSGNPCVHAAAVFLRLKREHKPTRAFEAVEYAEELDFPTATVDKPEATPTPLRPSQKVKLEDLYA